MDWIVIRLISRREVFSRLLILSGFIFCLLSCSSPVHFEWNEVKDIQLSKKAPGDSFLLFDDYIWIIDDVANEIHIFDRKGSYLKTIGATGKGPGEYVKISMIGNNEYYGIIYDARLSRLTVYEPDGEIKKISNIPIALLPLSTDIVVLDDKRILIPGYSGDNGLFKNMLHVYNWERESFSKHGIPIELNLKNNNQALPQYFVSARSIGNGKVFLSYFFRNKLLIYDYERDYIIKECVIGHAEKIKKQKDYLIENYYFGPVTYNEKYYFVPSLNKNKPGSYVLDKKSTEIIGFIQKAFQKSYNNVLYTFRDSVLYKSTVNQGKGVPSHSTIEKKEDEDIVELISRKSDSSIDPRNTKLISGNNELFLYCFGGKKIIEYDVINKSLEPLPFKHVKSFNNAIDIQLKENPYFTLRRVDSGPGLYLWDKTHNHVKMIAREIKNHFAFFRDGLVFQDIQDGYLFKWKEGIKKKIPFQGTLEHKKPTLKDIFLNEMLIATHENYIALACINRNAIYLLNRYYELEKTFYLPDIPKDYIVKNEIQVHEIPGGNRYCTVDKPQNKDLKIDGSHIYLISELIPGKVAKFNMTTGEVEFLETGFKEIVSIELFRSKVYCIGEQEDGKYKIETYILPENE